ncbi:MAG: HAD family hydrolase [Candidatus Diapherotrites archaeon]|nr:HAD family hydrolase [Candidatus Diapherotrites archaeon]
MKLKAVLMDLDGTLIDSIPLIMKSFDETIRHFGFKISRQKLRELSQVHSREVAYYFMDKNKLSFNLGDFVNYRRRVFLRLLKKEKDIWFEDSKFFLEKASKKYKVGIVTGSRWSFVNAVLGKKTRRFVNCIITSDDVEHKKPDIEPLEKALKKLKVKKEEIVFVGDSNQDGLMCRRAGVTFVAKRTGISTEFQLKKFAPIYIAKNFAEIEKLLGIE